MQRLPDFHSWSRSRSRRGLQEEKRSGRRAGPEVVVATVEQKDVEIDSEWVGTTIGYVNAQIFPKIQGYLLKQSYRDGSVVKAGDLLFEIDPRQFQAALDQAKRPARPRAGRARQERAGRDALHAARGRRAP